MRPKSGKLLLGSIAGCYGYWHCCVLVRESRDLFAAMLLVFEFWDAAIAIEATRMTIIAS